MTTDSRIYLYKTIIVGYSLFLGGVVLILAPTFFNISPQWGDRATILGVALMPTGLVSLVNEYFLKNDLLRGLRKELEIFLEENLEGVYAALSRRAMVCDTNPTAAICQAFSNANEEILLLNNWIPDFDGLKQGLSEALSRNVKVRILMISPESPFAVARAREIGMSQPDQVAGFLQVELDNICDFLRRNEALSAEVRVFDKMPAMPSYATETEIFIGWYFKGKRAVSCPSVHVRGRRTALRKEFVRNFDELWADDNTKQVYGDDSNGRRSRSA